MPQSYLSRRDLRKMRNNEMSNTTSQVEYQPSIPNVVRTGVYVLGVVTGFCVVLINGITAFVWPNYTIEVFGISGAIGTAVGWLSSSLGVAYRPTAQVPASTKIKSVDDSVS